MVIFIVLIKYLINEIVLLFIFVNQIYDLLTMLPLYL